MKLFCTLVCREIEREEDVFEDLVLAVERCESTRYGDKVDPSSDKVPCGARFQTCSHDRNASAEYIRAETAEWL